MRVALIVLAFVASSLALGCDPGPQVPPPRGVLLISADSLRVDRLGPYAEDGVTMPHLAELAAAGTVYRNAWSTSPWTAPSMVSVFSGLMPPSHGVVYRDDTTPTALPTLSRMLEAAGWAYGNFAFFSELSYFRNRGLGPAVRGLSHATVAASFRAWLGDVPAAQPYFAWVHLLEAHLPYGASGYRATEVSVPGSSGLERAQLEATVPVGTATFEQGDRDRLLALYDRDVAELDHVLGEVLGALDEHGRRDDTLVVFVADHGEELLEHGWVGHASTAIDARLWPEIVRIPLIVAGPGVAVGQSDALVQQTDILPTVLARVGLPAPSTLDGRVLPGAGAAEPWRWPWQPKERETAFFDSAPGGNLTPAERRGERLQGATDGQCIVEQWSGSSAAGSVFPAHDGAECDEPRTERLHRALARWQAEQTRQRLAILRSAPTSTGPADSDIASWLQTIAVTNPRDGATVRFTDQGGQLALAWEGGDGPDFWLDYRLDGPTGAVEGKFALSQRGVVFGPVPEGFWNDLAGYSPYRIRILDEHARARSPWVTFTVERVEPKND